MAEAELFGHTRGAFTGAVKDKTGLFEAANGGTIFLDEIGDMAMPLQARILRVVQENEVKPLGDTRTRKIDVRIVSATNKNLQEAILKETFREDLFYRLNVLPIHIPPLRERPEDIPPLLDHFLKKEAMRFGLPPKKLSRDALDFLVSYCWPGNVRELENFVKHILIITDGDTITREDLALHFTAVPSIASPAARAAAASPRPEAKPPEAPPQDAASFFDGHSWEQIERDYVLYLLEKNKWHITRAAKEAGVNRSTFDSRMKKLQISK